ncbi:DUF6768 family protein [Pseudomarimonas salicorniae]|uniref:Holin-X, holin superfamily III n=1 Tax=Pseudomarimonas salicorniae TaxID=2933270 RepID=A0ABT0GJW1_9GAMM|nr:DUF6768 family protein [Lysobacter sp. CAU 1642]MCK7594832.1 hypothetical protein [Lysobacter sp. CAU 1642]
MDKHDDIIRSALDAEDRALLAAHAEPGYFAQAIGLFRGRLGWTIWISYLGGLLAFAGSMYGLWQVWHLEDPAAMLRWGVLSVLLFQFSSVAKGYLANHLEANRTLREIKRVELQIALLREPAKD